MGSWIRATNLWGLGDLVREVGGDPERLQERFGLAPRAEFDEDAFVPLPNVLRLLEAAAEEFACPDFGLRLAHWQGIDILGPVAVIARNAQTVLDGLESIASYLYVHSPALRLAVQAPDGGPHLRCTYEMTELTLPESRQGYELSLANAVRIIRLLGGDEARPSAVAFQHEQLGPNEVYADALGCPVRFGQAWCGFEVSTSLAESRIDSADPQTLRIATKYLESEYLPNTATLADRVGALAHRLLPTGQCSADAIADQLGMHPRTLQRRLAGEGARCQDVIDGVRREQAVKYLADPRFQLSQISALLGYAEQSTLNHSCRRWFGTTPRQYRSMLNS